MTRLNDISLMRERPGTRGHLEPWSPLLGPPQGGTGLATPGHRGRWASGHELDDYELPGHGLVSPRSLCPHSTRTPRWFTGRSLSGRPAQRRVFITHPGRHTGFPVTEKTRGLALGPSASLQHPQSPPLRAQALPSISNMSEDGWGHAGFTARAEQGGDADVTGTMLCGNGLGDPLNTGDYATAKYRSVHVIERTQVCVWGSGQPIGKSSHTTPWGPDEPQAGRCVTIQSHLVPRRPSRASGRKAGGPTYSQEAGRTWHQPAFPSGDTLPVY